jgi:hypothetical protein
MSKTVSLFVFQSRWSRRGVGAGVGVGAVLGSSAAAAVILRSFWAVTAGHCSGAPRANNKPGAALTLMIPLLLETCWGLLLHWQVVRVGVHLTAARATNVATGNQWQRHL